MALKTAIWLSDHKPTQEQREYLNQRGYEVQHLASPPVRRWNSAHEAYAAMKRKFGTPDIIIMILPSDVMGGMFLKLVGNIPVYQPEMVMDKKTNQWKWLGTWVKLNGTRYLKSKEPIPLAY